MNTISRIASVISVISLLGAAVLAGLYLYSLGRAAGSADTYIAPPAAVVDVVPATQQDAYLTDAPTTA